MRFREKTRHPPAFWWKILQIGGKYYNFNKDLRGSQHQAHLPHANFLHLEASIVVTYKPEDINNNIQHCSRGHARAPWNIGQHSRGGGGRHTRTTNERTTRFYSRPKVNGAKPTFLCCFCDTTAISQAWWRGATGSQQRARGKR